MNRLCCLMLTVAENWYLKIIMLTEKMEKHLTIKLPLIDWTPHLLIAKNRLSGEVIKFKWQHR